MVTCYDCRNNRHEKGDTENGFCMIHNDPIGGLSWTDDMFDKFISHIFPKTAPGICGNFSPKGREEIRIYGPIVELLCERITEKHNQYGTSYLDRDYEWMRQRLEGEIKELDGELFSPHLSGENAVTEALDVAIVAILIADKKRRENIFVCALAERDRWRGNSGVAYNSFADPAPF